MYVIISRVSTSKDTTLNIVEVKHQAIAIYTFITAITVIKIDTHMKLYLASTINVVKCDYRCVTDQPNGKDDEHNVKFSKPQVFWGEKNMTL